MSTSALTSSSNNLSEYYYIDTTGKSQGPFSELSMRTWYNNGYFNNTLRVKYNNEPYISIEDRIRVGLPFKFTIENINEKEKDVIKEKEKEKKKEEKLNDEDPNSPNYKLWYYIDKQDKVQGPFPSSHMEEWFTAGYFPPETPIRSPHLTGHKYKRLSALQKNPDFFLQDSMFQWIYIDPNGDEQGPFWNDEMAEWWTEGLLPPTLLCKKVVKPSFLSIQDHFNCEFMKACKAAPALDSVNEIKPAETPAPIIPITNLTNPNPTFIPPPPKPKCLTNSTLPNPPAPISVSTNPTAEATSTPVEDKNKSLAAFLLTDKTWYFRGPDGKELGPFTSIQMHSMIAAATITPHTQVRRKDEPIPSFLNKRMLEIQKTVEETSHFTNDYTTVASFNLKSGKFQRVKSEQSPMDRFFDFEKWQEEKNELQKMKKQKKNK